MVPHDLGREHVTGLVSPPQLQRPAELHCFAGAFGAVGSAFPAAPRISGRRELRACAHQPIVRPGRYGCIGKSALAETAAVLQALGFWCCHFNLTLDISHIAGERNVWADALSRSEA